MAVVMRWLTHMVFRRVGAEGLPCTVSSAGRPRSLSRAQEAKWEAFTKYCADRVKDLQQVKAESSTHALHDHYSLNRLFQRYAVTHCR
jgi:hypothetical protein